ncbi:MAG TPA: MMPL family transporter [Streptosporangiaceae bacterium]|nr:MMPL family transporter [Streptosporangiaceae bacterium]
MTSLAATPATRRRPVVERIAGWSARHRKTAVFGWLLLVAVVFLAGQALGTKSVPPYDPGQSGQAQRALQQITGDYQPAPTENVLIQGGTGGLRDHAARAVEAALRGVPSSAADVRGPRLSADGRSELVTFTVPGKAADTTTTVQAAQQAVAAVQARYPGLTVAESGDASISGAVSTALGHDFHKAEETSVPITLLLLLVVFGSLIAAGIPLLLAITAVMAAISLLSVVGQWLPVGSSTSEVVLLIGMAVGIDYSLFYLRREREERARGASHAEALRIAAGTSGKAVLISGLTVMVALAGLFLTGLSIFDGVALGSIAVVGIAVVGSLTVLPAVLSWLGPRLERGRVPLLRRRARATRPSRLWGALARQVVKHPLAWGGIASLALLALAAPALGMRIGYPAIDAPKGLPVVQTMDRIERAFPQGPSPAEVVVTGKDLGGPAVRHAVEALRGRATASGPIRGPISAVPVAGDRALLISVPLAGDGSDSASANALATLRNQVLPSTLGTVPGVSFAVTGDTASNVDFNQQMRDTVPLVFAAVAAAAFVLLAVAFGSIAIPLISILLNLLSVGAAYGLVTLIFQDGRLQGPLGYTSFGGIIAWEPLFMFVFLFGISMDYHVFLLSRIRELRTRGASTRDAVTGGIASSAGVVTSAAFIMVAVFSVFATLSLIDLKILGIGMAAAVLIDATVVRGVLMPAALSLLGDRTWAAPRWLRRRADRAELAA